MGFCAACSAPHALMAKLTPSQIARNCSRGLFPQHEAVMRVIELVGQVGGDEILPEVSEELLFNVRDAVERAPTTDEGWLNSLIIGGTYTRDSTYRAGVEALRHFFKKDSDSVTDVTFPVHGTYHAHTGCFHVACPMPGGLELWLLGGYPQPKFEGERPRFPVAQTLGGYLRPRGSYSESFQQRLEDSAALTGLPVDWVQLPFPSMHRWFQFKVAPELVSELFRRLQTFASESE